MQIILRLLKARQRTPAWLCRQAGISPTLFTLMKKGERTITEITKVKISFVLGFSKEILFKKESNK